MKLISYITAAVAWNCTLKEAIYKLNAMVASGRLIWHELRNGHNWWRYDEPESLDQDEKPCARCNRLHIGKSKYCSLHCATHEDATGICIHCGITFKYVKYRSTPQQTCSRACSNRATKSRVYYGSRENFGEMRILER